jgi:hypothetical protein
MEHTPARPPSPAPPPGGSGDGVQGAIPQETMGSGATARRAPYRRRVVVALIVSVLHRPQAVLHQLKHHVVQVGRHVRKHKARLAVDGHVGRGAVLSHAHRARVVDGVLRHLHASMHAPGGGGARSGTRCCGAGELCEGVWRLVCGRVCGVCPQQSGRAHRWQQQAGTLQGGGRLRAGWCLVCAAAVGPSCQQPQPCCLHPLPMPLPIRGCSPCPHLHGRALCANEPNVCRLGRLVQRDVLA